MARAAAQAEHERLATAFEAARHELDVVRERAARADAAALQEHERAERTEAELAQERQRVTASLSEQERAERAVAENQAEIGRYRDRLAARENELASAEAEVTRVRDALDAARRAPVPAAPVIRLVPEPAVAAVAPAPPASEAGPRWSPAAQRKLAAALGRTSEWSLALRDAVKVIGPEGGWDAVCAWTPDPRVQRLRCAAMWTDPARELAQFETSSWQQLPPLQGTQLGRALGHDQLSWLTAEDASGDGRVAAARQAGLACTVLAPIHDGNASIAVLELLSRDTPEPRDELAVALEAVMLQLAHLCRLLRLSAEPRWGFGRV
jgi:hypothetical protein